MRPKKNTHLSRQANRCAIDQALIAAHDSTILMSALRGLLAGCFVCMIPLLAIVVGGPILDVMGII